MSRPEPESLLAAAIAFQHQLMSSWLEACLATNQHCVGLWAQPFAPPLPDEIEQPGDLDIPGPLERDNERKLFA